jgi:hypothetical protein
MSYEVDIDYQNNLFQAGEFQDWNWMIESSGRYWSLAVWPMYANLAVCQLTNFWWTTDNSLNATMHYSVRMLSSGNQPGGVFGIRAISEHS